LGNCFISDRDFVIFKFFANKMEFNSGWGFIVLFLVFVVGSVHPHPQQQQQNKYGLSRASCRAKWERCMEGDATPPEEPRPSSEECEGIIKRRFGCIVSGNVVRGPRIQENGDNEMRYQGSGNKNGGRQSNQKPLQRQPNNPRQRYQEDSDPTVEIVQKTRTTKDNSKLEWEREEGGPGVVEARRLPPSEESDRRPSSEAVQTRPSDIDNIRRRDKVRKEKERIFVKEDLIEVEEEPEEEGKEPENKTEKPKTGVKDNKKDVDKNNDEKTKSKVKEMVRDEMGVEQEGEDNKAVGDRVVKMLQRGLW